MTRPTLHLLAGLAGSGKSTLAARLAVEAHALPIAEDDWTSALWPGEPTSLEAYRDCSRRLRGVLWPHVGADPGCGPASGHDADRRQKRLIHCDFNWSAADAGSQPDWPMPPTCSCTDIAGSTITGVRPQCLPAASHAGWARA